MMAMIARRAVPTSASGAVDHRRPPDEQPLSGQVRRATPEGCPRRIPRRSVLDNTNSEHISSSSTFPARRRRRSSVGCDPTTHLGLLGPAAAPTLKLAAPAARTTPVSIRSQSARVVCYSSVVVIVSTMTLTELASARGSRWRIRRLPPVTLLPGSDPGIVMTFSSGSG